MNDNLSFNISIICLIIMITSGSIYLISYPLQSLIDFSSPLIWIALISGGIGIIIDVERIVNNLKEK